jgi:hypothetical protein
MSVPQTILDTIKSKLAGRMLLTFSVKPDWPQCCLFFEDDGDFYAYPLLINDANFLKKILLLLVYNTTTKRLESLDGSWCLYVDLSFQPYYLIQQAVTAGSVVPTEQQFEISKGTILYTGVTPNLEIYIWIEAIQMCAVDDTSCLNSMGPSNIQLLNWSTIDNLKAKVAAIQDTKSLCCYFDDDHLITALLLWTNGSNSDDNYSGIGLNQPIFPVQSSMNECQQNDSKCACPDNKLCWLFNNSNVPCCIQGNKADSKFLYNPPLIITQIKQDCVNAATKCYQWGYNDTQVPCCIQRTPEQWKKMQYDTDTAKFFSNKQDCQNANSNCQFQSLVTQKSNNTDYHALILESNYTSDCDQIRTGNWASSSDCPNDPYPTGCAYGNCTNNYCSAWNNDPSDANYNPYLFKQQVMCLPNAASCCPGKTVVPSNPGTPNVSFTCK